MAMVKRQGREKPVKIEQRKAEDWGEGLRGNKQHPWLARYIGRAQGRGKHRRGTSLEVGMLSCLKGAFSFTF